MTSPFTVQPVAETDPVVLPDSLGFGRLFTDRMFSQRYAAGQGWHDATIGPYRPITLDPATTVYHNGQMIFDGTKAYRRDDGHINLFRTELNAARFNDSATRMGMPPVDVATHVEAITALVRLEHRWVPSRPGTALYIRPVMIATEKTLEVRASREYLHYVILSPVAPYFADGFAPVSVYVSDDYVRAVRGGTGEAKTPGNYAGSIAATEVALAKGYQQVLWLDGVERRYIDEVGAMNIAFVYDGREIVTPTLTGAILKGITRRSLLELAPDLGYPVSERRITIDEVLAGLADGRISEMFGMGTGAVIAPVGRLHYQGQDITVRDGQPGPVATRLYDELTGLQYGRRPDPYGWTHLVEVPGATAVRPAAQR
ncbi:MAG: branched-chain amino acid aminotransferase [Gammaproteobacteria bacterium]|nr:branched-chain amino acid aminotransferase [Gammaproteobacteria bacterium]MCP5198676.1 branched-chain amino acid aminotransferase [Gammaproteobacteria bacterium]